jgi:hypothetical protein
MPKVEIRVPGAERIMLPARPDDPKSLHVPAYDKKGRPLWRMPGSSGKHGHSTRLRGDEKPSVHFTLLHRGVSAAMARYYRGQARRCNREGKKARYDMRGIPTGGHKIPPKTSASFLPRVGKLPV